MFGVIRSGVKGEARDSAVYKDPSVTLVHVGLVPLSGRFLTPCYMWNFA